ncbi:hypothetical protein PRVXH_002140 [Proteinivorax hydrogeniformans]|uniref:Uncharacterized protein n=1 Tax=Proteinivorax hydrogeniformans TaxID=1826727 RepID=A0AAU8HRK5_9FIRM
MSELISYIIAVAIYGLLMFLFHRKKHQETEPALKEAVISTAIFALLYGLIIVLWR